MSKPAPAAVCNACYTTLREGQSAFYDDKREVHYCNQSCFVEWARDNVDMLAYEYRKENCERVDL